MRPGVRSCFLGWFFGIDRADGVNTTSVEQIAEQRDTCKRSITEHRDISVVPDAFGKKHVVDEAVHVVFTAQRIVTPATDVPII